jgi:hypothetical protein
MEGRKMSRRGTILPLALVAIAVIAALMWPELPSRDVAAVQPTDRPATPLAVIDAATPLAVIDAATLAEIVATPLPRSVVEVTETLKGVDAESVIDAPEGVRDQLLPLLSGYQEANCQTIAVSVFGHYPYVDPEITVERGNDLADAVAGEMEKIWKELGKELGETLVVPGAPFRTFAYIDPPVPEGTPVLVDVDLRLTLAPAECVLAEAPATPSP